MMSSTFGHILQFDHFLQKIWIDLLLRTRSEPKQTMMSLNIKKIWVCCKKISIISMSGNLSGVCFFFSGAALSSLRAGEAKQADIGEGQLQLIWDCMCIESTARHI